MRVTVFTRQCPVDSETFVVRQAQALGAEVCSLVPSREAPLPSDVRVVELPGFRARTGPAEAATRVWNLLRHGNACRLGRACESAWSAHLAERRPDVVLAQFGDNALRALAACRRRGTPLVAHFHGYDIAPGRKLRWPDYRISLRRALPNIAASVVVNEGQAQTLRELGAAPDKIALIPCGVPTGDFPPSKRVDRNPCAFLFVGRMVRGKSPLETIRAFAECARHSHGATLTMIGAGPLLDSARRLAAQTGLGDRLRLLGSQPNEAVREQLSQASAFVLAPRAERAGSTEGWPVSIAEAASSAVPVLSTRHAAIPTQVVNGKTGFLVEEGDWSGLAQRMIELAGSPELRARLGRAGRAHILEVGNFDACLARLRDLLERAAGAKL